MITFTHQGGDEVAQLVFHSLSRDPPCRCLPPRFLLTLAPFNIPRGAMPLSAELAEDAPFIPVVVEMHRVLLSCHPVLH